MIHITAKLGIEELTQQTQNIFKTFAQRLCIGPTLYKCYKNVLFAGKS